MVLGKALAQLCTILLSLPILIHLLFLPKNYKVSNNYVKLHMIWFAYVNLKWQADKRVVSLTK